MDKITVFPEKEITNAGVISQKFLSLGIKTFIDACQYVHRLPYGYNSHKDDISYSEYMEFTEKWLSKAFNLLRDDGRMCLNIPLDKNKGGQQSVYSDILQITFYLLESR